MTKKNDWVSKMPGGLTENQRNILQWLRENPGDPENKFKQVFGARDYLYLKENSFIRVHNGKVYVEQR